MSSFASRVIGACRLDAMIYEEVEADRSAYPQALAVVFLSSLGAGIGASSRDGLSSILLFSVLSVVGWLLWAWIAYFVGVQFLATDQTEADLGQLLRTTAFAGAPGILRAIGAVPGWTVPVFAAASLWMLAAFVVAIRQALDYDSTVRAIAVCLIGWILYTGLFVLLDSMILVVR